VNIADNIAPEPTPGSFYRIVYGDTLLGVAGRAFGVPSGSTRLERARLINRSVYNDRFRGGSTDLFPEGQVSFNPRYVKDPDAQFAAGGPCPSGHGYAILWIPTEAGDEPEPEENIELASDHGRQGLSGDEDQVAADEPDEPMEPTVLPLADEDECTLVAHVCRNRWNTIDHRPGGHGWFSA
jgi:hypothetical protein